MTRQEKIKARIQDLAERMSTNPSYGVVDHMKKYNISESTAKGDLKVAQPICDAIEDKIFEAYEQAEQAELKTQ